MTILRMKFKKMHRFLADVVRYNDLYSLPALKDSCVEAELSKVYQCICCLLFYQGADRIPDHSLDLPQHAQSE